MTDPQDKKNLEEENIESEPWYEPDGECDCSDDGIEPEWMWSSDEGCFICQGCGHRN